VCTAVAGDGSWSCTPEAPLSTGGHEVVVRDGPFESGVSSLIVVERSLSGGGIGSSCASTGGAAGWWLLALVALLFWRRRPAHAPVRLRPARLTVSLLVATSALAQTPVPGFELERVRLNGAGAHGLLVESADLLPKYGYRAALTFHDQQDPLVLVENGKRVGSVVSNRIGLHLSGAFTITDWLDGLAAVPHHPLAVGERPLEPRVHAGAVGRRGWHPVDRGSRSALAGTARSRRRRVVRRGARNSHRQ